MPASKRSRQKTDIIGNRIEAVLGLVSALIILALAGFLLYEGITKTGGEPALRLEVSHLLPQGNGLVVEVHNDGTATAADVEIIGTIPDDPLPRQVTLDYAPAESTRQIALTFGRPVTADEVTLTILGYIDP